MRHSSAVGWAYIEELDLKRFRSPLPLKMPKEEEKVYQEQVKPLLDMDPSAGRSCETSRRGQGTGVSGEQQREWSGYLNVVNQAGPYYGKKALATQEQYCAAIAERLELFERAERCLREGTPWTPPVAPQAYWPPSNEERANFEKTYLPKMRAMRIELGHCLG